MITCPYCKDRFTEDYYTTQHVPCPSPKGDMQILGSKVERQRAVNMHAYVIEQEQKLGLIDGRTAMQKLHELHARAGWPFGR